MAILRHFGASKKPTTIKDKEQKTMNNQEYNQTIKDYETLGIPAPLAKKLADIHLKERTNPYYERSKQDKDVFEEAHKIMASKAVLPTTTPFITL